MCHNRAALRTTDDVLAHVGRICFKTGPPGKVGIESEWLVTDSTDPRRCVSAERLRALLADADGLPARSLLSLEPGGQVELSTACAADLSGACFRLGSDLAVLDMHAARHGLDLCGLGLDPMREPPRLLSEPRYVAMESYFDRAGTAGRTMMTSTASLQVCLDIGYDPADARRRWRLANALTPVLIAAFANSPFHRRRPTGWRCTRQAVWSEIDPLRTRQPDGADPVEGWTRYALAAPVMGTTAGQNAPAAHPGPHPGPDPGPHPGPGMTFGEWLACGRGGSPGTTDRAGPTVEDLEHHLTTLFPPVRPRGWFEFRAIDAQAPRHWPVPAAVATALLDDPRASDQAAAACEPVAGLERAAARDALADPRLAHAATLCFDAAVAALPRLGAPAELTRLVDAYAERYPAARRCPADDVLDAWRAGQSLLPEWSSFVRDREEVFAWTPANSAMTG